MATRDVTLTDIESTVADTDIVLLDFWASWCGPCRQFGPVFEKASEDNTDIVFGKIDTEAQQELGAAFNVRAIPTLMAFRGGYLVYREAGAMSGPQFEELVKAVKALDIEKLKEQANAQQEGAEA